MIKEIPIKTEREMTELGVMIGRIAFPNMLIALNGDLGAGKTTFVKGMGKGLGIKEIINSPTFTILKIYKGRLSLYHMDFYRIDSESGDEYLEEYFYKGGVCAVEWADNVNEILPDERLEITIGILPEGKRSVRIESFGDNYDRITGELKP